MALKPILKEPSASSRQLAICTTYGTYAALLLAFSIWQISRANGPSYLFWFIQIFPLIILLPGLIVKNAKSFIWLCFIILAYFVKGVEGSMSTSRDWIDITMLVLSVFIFVSSMLASRWIAMSARYARQNKLENQ